MDDDGLFDEGEPTQPLVRSLVVGPTEDVEDYELSLMRRATV